VKVTLVAPAGTVTDAGNVAAELDELDRVTTLPLGPAGPLSVTVPVMTAVLPPTTDVAESLTLETVAGVTVRARLAVSMP